MQKTKLFVTASAVCFALAGAAFSEGKSESSAALLYRAGFHPNQTCIQATASIPENCSILGGGLQCSVLIIDSWGGGYWVPGYGSPLVGNLCLLPIKEVL